MMASILTALLLSLSSRATTAFTPLASPTSFVVSTLKNVRRSSRVYSVMDTSPSDYDSEDLASFEKTVAVDENEEDATIRDELKRELLVMASITNRGECATTEEKDLMIEIVTELEALNPTANPAMNCDGEWDLCLCNTHLFLSSPFFMAIRGALGDENKELAMTGLDIHAMATRAGSIGRVRHTITDNELKSEVDLDVGVLPGIPMSLKGTIQTKAELKKVAPETWELSIKGTKTKRSNIPFLNQFIDDLPLELPLGDIYSSFGVDVPKIILKTFYVDEGIRIMRDMDDNIFVYAKA